MDKMCIFEDGRQLIEELVEENRKNNCKCLSIKDIEELKASIEERKGYSYTLYYDKQTDEIRPKYHKISSDNEELQKLKENQELLGDTIAEMMAMLFN